MARRVSGPWPIAAVLCLLGPWRGLSQEPDLNTVLARAAAYVADYQKQLVGVVAEEHYRQNVQNISRAGRSSRQFRELRSDVLMVKLPDEERWLQFRDVFEVDRKPVRDRDERLYKLFVTPTEGDRRAQAETIQAESTRLNIGPVQRTINMPILALLFFDVSWQRHLALDRLKLENPRRFEGLAAPEAVWRIAFTETDSPTLVRGAGGKDIRSRGEIWVDTATGRILQTEMTSEDVGIVATIEVRYATQPGFTLLLPQEMRELYRVRVNESRIDGRALYSRFRQFTVTTTEKPKG